MTCEIIELWKQPRPFWKAKTFYFPHITSAISYILKLFGIRGDNLCEKNRKIQKVSFGPIFLHWRGKQVKLSHHSIQQYQWHQVTYSCKTTWKYNIWWLPGQFYTHNVLPFSEWTTLYPGDLKNMNIWCDFTWLLLEFSILI